MRFPDSVGLASPDTASKAVYGTQYTLLLKTSSYGPYFMRRSAVRGHLFPCLESLDESDVMVDESQ